MGVKNVTNQRRDEQGVSRSKIESKYVCSNNPISVVNLIEVLLMAETITPEKRIIRNKCTFAKNAPRIPSYLKFGAHATHGVGVKFSKWEEFFPYLTQKEPLWNFVISHIMCDFTHNEYFFTQCSILHLFQCVILHTVCNFTQNVILNTVCNSTQNVWFYTQCAVLHIGCNFTHRV